MEDDLFISMYGGVCSTCMVECVVHIMMKLVLYMSGSLQRRPENTLYPHNTPGCTFCYYFNKSIITFPTN
ncbi:hypothetical protein Hanom_Chr07g00639671 [Helianthus anomalus]